MSLCLIRSKSARLVSNVPSPRHRQAAGQNRLQVKIFADRSPKHFGHSGDNLIDVYYFKGKWLLTRKGKKSMCKKCSPLSPVKCAVNETLNTTLTTG
ncbi:MAG: hypothetical protein E8A46_05075 [Bradyrhizobium sp.]|jgi:hypothetical protein|nr:MAG: hypothetical protein E8A46_05075 [Bradyrhizobium sp.]